MLQEGLNSGNLNGKARTKFISSVASAMFHDKSYPTKEEYDHIAEQIVNCYPLMSFGPGKGHVSCNAVK